MRVVEARTKDHILFYEYFHGDDVRSGRQPSDRLDRNGGETN